MKFLFKDLPEAVHQLSLKLDHIESLLTNNNPVSQPESDRWFDLKEFREYHPEKPAKATVYAWVREKRIPYHKRGKKLVFLKSEIDSNIKTGKVKSISEVEQDAENFLTQKKRR